MVVEDLECAAGIVAEGEGKSSDMMVEACIYTSTYVSRSTRAGESSVSIHRLSLSVDRLIQEYYIDTCLRTTAPCAPNPNNLLKHWGLNNDKCQLRKRV